MIKAPFRISLGGGGTDLPSYYENYGGYVISAAVNKYLYVNINEPVTSDKIKLYYAKVEAVEDASKIEHDIIRESLKFFGINKPLEIASMADIEAGTGMGSSSSFLVALLAGLNLMQRKVISPALLAEEACYIEINKVGKKIGKQDQYISAFGGVQEMKIDKSGKVIIEPVLLGRDFISELEYRMVLFYTGIKRPAALILDKQSDSLKKKNRGVLKIMHEIKNIGFEIKKALLKEDIDRIGGLFLEHWLLKRDISPDMASEEIESWLDKAYFNGAIGGKLIGAGGGGFILFVCEEGRRKELIRAMELLGLRFVDFRFDFEGVKIMTNL
jgi:D-glycero-alpha-D-manno-heptose-7-phosphate kinase